MNFAGDALREVAEALATELLLRARLAPGSMMIDLASILGAEVEAMRMPTGTIGACCREEWSIVFEPTGYQPRDEFTIAHEIMELFAPRSVLELPREVKERFCDLGAAALLLPRAAFLRTLELYGWNVDDQRRVWPRVSAKVITARIDEVLDRSLSRVLTPA
jgi:hypothetical protein